MTWINGRGWLAFLVVGLAASLAVAATSSIGAMGALTEVVGFTAAIIGLSIWRRSPRAIGRPWLFFSLAALAFVFATIVRIVHGLIVSSAQPPFPSPADAVALSGHVALIIGGTLLGHLRSPERDRTAIIDGAIIAVGVQTPVWAWLLWPYLTDPSVPVGQRVINAVYTCMTMAVLATIGRLAVGPGARTASYRLLASAVLVVFAQDVLVTINTVGGLGYRFDRALAAPCFVLFGAAALHPDRLRIAEAAARLDVRLSGRRVAALICSLLIVPAVIIVQLALGQPPTLVVGVVSLTVLILLVMARFTLLARAQERATALQAIQRDANAELAAASSRHGMHRAALRAAIRLLDDPSMRVSMAQYAERSLRIVDAVGRDADSAVATSTPIGRLPAPVADALQHRRAVSVDHVAPIDVGSGAVGRDRICLLVVPLTTQGELAGALVISTDSPIGGPVGQSIEMLGSTLSLALESAALTENLLRRRSERRFRALVENSSDIVLVVNEDRFITFASPATQRLLGFPETTLLGTHPARWIHPDDWPRLAYALEGQSPTPADDGDLEVRARHIDGSHRWFEIRTKDLRHDTEIDGLVVTAREISDRKATEQELADREARFRALVQNSSDVVAVVDHDGCCSYISPAVTELLGYAPDQLEGRFVLDMIAPEAVKAFRGRYPRLASAHLGPTLPVSEVETQVVHANGDLHTVDITLTDMRHEPTVQGIVLNIRDVTERKALERDLRYQALHDSLTGLPNRTMFTQQINAATGNAGEDQVGVGVLVIDLDDFKTVNDSLGHAVGDELLMEAARRLSTRLSAADLAARLGGDEFAVLVVDPVGDRGPMAVADEVLAIMAEPFTIRGREIRVTCSIGVAVATADRDAEILLRSADVAMYLAKDQGKACAARFEDHLHTNVYERLELKADLARAIEDGQLTCHYQPIVSLQTGRITGVEALVRWDHPVRGRLGPDAFIGLAEDTGLIVPLGRFVLREACQQLREWQLQLAATSTLSMSVNLSVRQLLHEDIVDEVRAAIDDASLDPSTVTLEITETTLMHDTEANGKRLRQLRDLGVSLAVDDFGTGYSSLQYIQKFPIDIIKVDRSFVSGLGTNPGDGAVVQSMIELSQRLGVHTVAEGIDRPEQVMFLRSLGADLGQGFLFSPPVPAEEITRMLTNSPDQNPQFLRP